MKNPGESKSLCDMGVKCDQPASKLTSLAKTKDLLCVTERHELFDDNLFALLKH